MKRIFFKKKVGLHTLALTLLDIDIVNESVDEKTNDVIEKINNDEWEEVTPSEFYESYHISKHLKMLTPYSESELSEMKLYKLKGYNIGFCLKKWKDDTYSEIVCLHKNEPEVKQVGNLIVQSAINKGGLHLDHFDGMLSDLYSNNGFIEYKRDKYNPDYDEGGMLRKQYGTPDIIYRHHINYLS